jgi:hypothetical protein
MDLDADQLREAVERRHNCKARFDMRPIWRIASIFVAQAVLAMPQTRGPKRAKIEIASATQVLARERREPLTNLSQVALVSSLIARVANCRHSSAFFWKSSAALMDLLLKPRSRMHGTPQPERRSIQ